MIAPIALRFLTLYISSLTLTLRFLTLAQSLLTLSLSLLQCLLPFCLSLLSCYHRLPSCRCGIRGRGCITYRIISTVDRELIAIIFKDDIES